MKKFNIRKVLDGLKEQASSSASSGQSGALENNLMHETLQSENFQLCKTVRHGFPYQPSSMAHDPVQKILAIGTQSGALRLMWQIKGLSLAVGRAERAGELQQVCQPKRMPCDPKNCPIFDAGQG
ncbi:unnamed protein product [Coregonus sp. 'balchen']|nr:unnamed protein product [Coregonus sp. 'balchen']